MHFLTSERHREEFCVILHISRHGVKKQLKCMIMHIANKSGAIGIAAIGEQIREARKQQGIRQDELAIAAGVSTRSVHQIEHGKPTGRLDTLTRVLEVLGLALTVTARSRVNRAPRAGDGG